MKKNEKAAADAAAGPRVKRQATITDEICVFLTRASAAAEIEVPCGTLPGQTADGKVRFFNVLSKIF